MHTQQSRNISSFDGIRGLLAVWVMLSHVTQLVGGPSGLISRGGIAVDLFMFVSGFLMVWTVEGRGDREPVNALSTWRSFFIRRFFRIAPLFYLALVLAYGFAGLFDSWLRTAYEAIGIAFDRPFRYCAPSVPVDVILHLSFLFGLFPCSSSSNFLPDWSLSLEMQFYLLFPIIYLVMSRSRIQWLPAVLLVCAGIAQAYTSVYAMDNQKLLSYPQPSILPLRINCFLVGMSLAFLVWRGRRDGWLCLALVLNAILFQRLTFTVLVASIVLMLFQQGGLWLKPGWTLVKPLALMERVLRLRMLRVLGDISFGIYLIHLFVVVPLVVKFNESNWFMSLSGDMRFVVVAAVSLPLVIFVALLLHEMVEKPMISIGKKLSAPPSSKPRLEGVGS